MPPTELPEMAGFRKAEGRVVAQSRFGGDFGIVSNNTIQRLSNLSRMEAETKNLLALSKLTTFADTEPEPGPCGTVPEALPPNQSPIVVPNEPIRQRVIERLQQAPGYVAMFEKAFPEAKNGQPINFAMVGEALAEFQLSLIFAKAPLDKFALGDSGALSSQEKAGGLLFFGKAGCVSCHSATNQLFTDFDMHNIGIPPLYPQNTPIEGAPTEGNVGFQGKNRDLDLGRAEFTDLNNEADWYRFRTSPLRNVGLQPTFMHNGAYTTLEDAVDHHLDAEKALFSYDPAKAKVNRLRRVANRFEIAEKISDKLKPVSLSKDEKDALVAFLRNGLTDSRARPSEACKQIPKSLPTANPLLTFEGCPSP